MSFFKFFLMTIVCFNLVIAHQTNEPTNKSLVAQSMTISAITGLMSGVLDLYCYKYISRYAALGFAIEPWIRQDFLKKVWIYNRLENNERDNDQQERSYWCGWSTSWIAWCLVVGFCNDGTYIK